MNHHVLAAKILLLLSLTATAQTISKPTKTATEPSPSQLEMIREGVQLHNAGEKEADGLMAKYMKDAIGRKKS